MYVPSSTPRTKRVPLTEAKRSQLKSRLRPIVEQFKQIAKDELVEMIDLLALIGRSVFLDANSEHFNKPIGQFFQSHLSGNPFKHNIIHYNLDFGCFRIW